MATSVDRKTVRSMRKRGAQLVDVLPSKEFAAEHIVGAVNIPLGEIPRRAGELRKDAAIIVYCEDYQCDLSPRAAVRLEMLGFDEVYDYAASKVDWKAAGWPTEGNKIDPNTIGRAAHCDVATCRTEDRTTDIAERIRASGLDVAVVVTDGNVIVGEIERATVEEHPGARCGDVMREGPSTYRPFVPIEELEPKLEKANRAHAIVSTSGGELIGIYLSRRAASTNEERPPAISSRRSLV